MYMYAGIKKFSMLVSFLIICTLLAGCTGDTGSSNATTPSTTTGQSSTAAYSAGDVIKNPQSPSQTALLIIGFNASADKYERALIYPNADGSWGYRLNTNTETVSRAIIDQLYTQKVTRVAPSAVPVRTHTTTLTPTSTTSSATTSTTTTTTVSPTGKPSFKKIVPEEGTAGTAIPITALTGTNFKSGATVILMKADDQNISATNVDVQSPTLMTCTFTPPSNATAGAWDIVITNPDGQYVRYSYIFSIHAPVGTATTTSSSDSEGITSISPTFAYGNDIAGGMRITGSNFQQGFTAKMTKSTNTNTEILARSVRWDSATQVTAWFTIPIDKQRGDYNVIVTNPDGTTRTLLNGFEVR